jgi:hypothetical protein
VFGTTKSMGDLNGDHYLIQLDLDGNILFEKTYGGSLVETGEQIIATKDGHLMLIGTTTSAGNGMKDMHVMKITEQGDLLWETTFGGALDDTPNSIIETSKNEFCIAGTSKSFGTGANDIYLVWMNQQGDLIRQKNHGGNDVDGSSAILELENQEIMLFGYTQSYGATSRDYYLLRMNSLGDSLWSQRYGGSAYEESHGMVSTPSGGFLMNGHSSSTDPMHNMYAVEVDSGGKQIWANNYGGSNHDGGHALLINNQGQYVFIARSMSFGEDDRDIYMVTTSADGNMISEAVIGGSKDDWGQDIKEYGLYYYIVGHSNANSGSDNDVYIVKYRR